MNTILNNEQLDNAFHFRVIQRRSHERRMNIEQHVDGFSMDRNLNQETEIPEKRQSLDDEIAGGFCKIFGGICND